MGDSLLAEPLLWLIGASEIGFWIFLVAGLGTASVVAGIWLVVGPLWATVFPGSDHREPTRV